MSHLIRAPRGPAGGVFVASTQNDFFQRVHRDAALRPRASRRSSSSKRPHPSSRCHWPRLCRTRADRRRAELERRRSRQASSARHHQASDQFRLADARFHREIAPRQRAPARVHELDARRSATAARRRVSGPTVDGNTILRSPPVGSLRASRKRAAGGGAARHATSPRVHPRAGYSRGGAQCG